MRLKIAILSGFFLYQSSQAIEPDGGYLTFCHFGPKTKILAPKESQKKKGCAGPVKAQGVMWKCGSLNEVERSTKKFLEKLNVLAREDCEKTCASRGPDCLGKYTSFDKCGLSVGLDEANATGRSFGCRQECSGQSFIYCSIYNAGFRTDNDILVKKQKPNCLCYRTENSKKTSKKSRNH